MSDSRAADVGPDRPRPESGSDSRSSGGPLVFLVFDVAVVVAVFMVASVAVGIIWSYLRIGFFAWPFVREAQFTIGLFVLVYWTIANRPGGRIRELQRNEKRTFGPPRPEHRVALYRRLIDRGSPDVEDVPGRDVHILAIGLSLLAVSVGVELVVLWRMGV